MSLSHLQPHRQLERVFNAWQQRRVDDRQTEASDFATTAAALQPNFIMQSDAFLTHVGTKTNTGGGTGGSGGQLKLFMPFTLR